MVYSEEQFKYGFWTKYNSKYFPKSIEEVKEYNNQKYLSIACTQLLKEKEVEKKILNEWIIFLPTVPVESIQFACHVPQKLLESVCKVQQVKSLYIKWTRARDISNLKNLKNLEYLYLGEASHINDLIPISYLANLKVLTIVNTSKIYEYDFLSNLTNLNS